MSEPWEVDDAAEVLHAAGRFLRGSGFKVEVAQEAGELYLNVMYGPRIVRLQATQVGFTDEHGRVYREVEL